MAPGRCAREWWVIGRALDQRPYVALACARTLVGLVAAAVDYHPVEVLLPGDPRGEVGASPWTAPRPFVLDMTAAERDLGYRPVASYVDAVQETARWLIGHVKGRAWQEALPPLAPAAEALFPYEEEDAVVRTLLRGTASRP